MKLYLFLPLFFAASLFGAPYGKPSLGSGVGEQRSALDSVKHELNNHEAELHMLSERIDNQENILTSFKQQLMDAHQNQKEMFEGSSVSSSEKMTSLEAINRSLVADLKQLRTHANESASTLAQYKQKIVDLEKAIDVQAQATDDLKDAVKAIMSALDVKETRSMSDDKSLKSYKVKAGDRLDKIAKAHQTTVKALKEVNHLTNDLIFEGQTLKLP